MHKMVKIFQQRNLVKRVTNMIIEGSDTRKINKRRNICYAWNKMF